ncbi:MAG: RNA methyltransferase [Ruminococcus sp.]|nr:RNA methyltransferase [Ruminococcus sp.]
MQMISSRDNPRVKSLIKLQKSAKYRREASMFIAEGLRICEDAVRSRAKILTLYATEAAMKKYPEKFRLLSASAEETILLSPTVFSQISDTQTPQGILCTIKTLDKTPQFGTIKDGGKFLALDCLQDPNNLGTILRSAEAFGVSGVILSADCCDIYNPKVVRGSMGALFRVPFMICDTIAGFLDTASELHSFAAVVNREAEKITEVTFQEPCVVVIGNEGNGLKQETISACQHKITIPMNGNAESLNASAAATVIIWEMLR